MRPIQFSSFFCAIATSAALAGDPGSPFDIETIVADEMWNNRSSVEIDADGVVHLVWAGQFSTDSTTAEVYYANNAPGNGALNIQQLTFNNVREEFPCLTLDHDGNVHVAVHTGVPGGNHVRYLNNVGAPPGEFNEWINITPPSGPFYVIVEVRVDSAGVAHFTFRSQTLGVPGEDVYYTTWSEAGGVGPLVNITNTPGQLAGASYLAIGPDDTVHLVYQNDDVFSGGPLVYKRKVNGTFVAVPTGVSGNVRDPMIEVSAANVVSIIYRQSNVLWLVESANGGIDPFTAPAPLFTGVTALPAFHERFALDADGRRHIAFSSNSQDLRGVWYIGESETGFEDPIKVDGENTGNQSTSIAVGPDGEVVVTYSLSGFDQVVFADLFAATLSPDAPCPGDLTGSGNVGVPDLLALLACWGPVDPGSGCEAADLTGSGNVGVPDLLALLAVWGACP